VSRLCIDCDLDCVLRDSLDYVLIVTWVYLIGKLDHVLMSDISF